ncbi:MAG: hypothetical protein ACSLFK_03785 [Gemmatimonadaceae bacterium]
MPASRGIVRDGLVVGLIGYSAVAIFYSIFDLLASRGPLHTVDLLGKALFRGLRDPTVLRFPVEPDTGSIFLYNALHLAVALAIGLVVVALVKHAEENPARRAIVLFVIVAGFFVTIAVIGFLTAPLRPLLPYWSIVIANTVAVVLGASYLLNRRPQLRRTLGSRDHLDAGAAAST